VNLGPTELLILLAIVLIFFGGSKLPKLARSLGQAQSEFKKGTREAEADPAEAVERGALQQPLPPTPEAAPGTPADRGRNPG
jgi:sec-independent protein translocase protein TatA